ncbi:protein inturned [Stomoxys calcitrans]|uniref:Protein inturned n=1 Tax=Stomoxys calcitrans TaxID=35570 RepID=A0A1I8Q9U1_STOCA|nr:protein inturned [Stomoxys calcitrans]
MQTEETSTNSSGSYSNSSSDSVANWEQYVGEDGSLFYIEYIPVPVYKNTGAGDKVEFHRDLPLRGGKKSCRRQPSLKGESNSADNHILFSNVNTSDDGSKTLELVITAADRYRFGRRSTAAESILGFSLVPFFDQPECLMVHGFVHDMPEFFQQGKHIPIGRGDWFKSLDNIEIRASNIDDLLLQFGEPTKVCLKFQGQNSVNSQHSLQHNDENEPTQCKIENYTQFMQHFEKLQKFSDNVMIFGLLILPPECYQSDDHKSSLYYYPEDTDNFLYKGRGSFLTLNTVLSEELKTKPFASTLTVNGEEFIVFYRNINGFLVLVSFLSSMVSISEGYLRTDEFLTYLSFMQPHMSLNSFKDTSFLKFMRNFCNVQRIRLLSLKERQRLEFLEESLKETKYLPLPKEAQLRMFDALSEMEAMDYRNWNDEPLHTHREFFIYGSTLYYDSFMLISQMPLDIRQYIEVFLRCRAVFEFNTKYNTKELYIWEEIQIPEYKTDRYFLAVCGRGHLILCVILKLFCSAEVSMDVRVEPSLFYIEEIQETIDHLVQCGIESLAMFWSVSNKRPEVQTSFTEGKSTETTKDPKKNEGSNKNHKSSPSSGNSSHAHRYDDDTQPCSSLGGSSVHSLTPSEDDSSKKRLISNADDSDSGSDWEHFMDENVLRCGTDAELKSQVTESLWKEINNVVPINISSGCTNDIYYYIYVDGINNTSFSPLKSMKDIAPFARDMHLGFHRIRQILQSSKQIRDLQKSPSAMIPVKEHGIAMEVTENSITYKFVVVGRLFLSPPKEVYICHKPEMPANMVELAFRLSFFPSG